MRGWVFRKREHGKILFYDIRTDSGDFYQVVIKEDKVGSKRMSELKNIPLESSIELIGEWEENDRAPHGKEFVVYDYKIHNISEEFPLAPKQHGTDVLLKLRHISIRFPKYVKVMKVRSVVMKYIREFFEKEGYYEVVVPIIQTSACEGGATLFKLDFYGKEAYLNQSGQLYLEALIFALGKVYTIDVCFRAEKSRTRRHLAEFWQLEAEGAFLGNDDIMDVEERMVKYVVSRLLTDKESRDLLKNSRSSIEELERLMKERFARAKYEKAIRILQEKGFNVKFGDDLGVDEELAIVEEFNRPVFITHYPKEIKAFYMKWSTEDHRVVLNHDLLVPKYGEIIGGSERETDIKKLEDRIRRERLDPETYWWYLDLRKYGSVKHSGFGLGIERFIAWLCDLPHIKDSVPFPRLFRRKDLI